MKVRIISEDAKCSILMSHHKYRLHVNHASETGIVTKCVHSIKGKRANFILIITFKSLEETEKITRRKQYIRPKNGLAKVEENRNIEVHDPGHHTGK